MLRNFMVESITDALLIALPLSLLHLYHQGTWTDPITFILYSELAMLFAMPLFALWRVFTYIRERRRHDEQTEVS